jgi:hypothetical protein
MINKRLIMFMSALGATIGGTLPMLFGDYSLLDGWGVLGAFIGGIIGIIVGVKIGKRF